MKAAMPSSFACKVHLTGGCAALAGCLLLGRRIMCRELEPCPGLDKFGAENPVFFGENDDPLEKWSCNGGNMWPQKWPMRNNIWPIMAL
jgi:ammonia channel protein AmtB